MTSNLPSLTKTLTLGLAVALGASPAFAKETPKAERKKKPTVDYKAAIDTFKSATKRQKDADVLVSAIHTLAKADGIAERQRHVETRQHREPEIYLRADTVNVAPHAGLIGIGHERGDEHGRAGP